MAAGDVTNELMYELLKSIQADLADLRSEVREYRADNLVLKGHVVALMQSEPNQDALLAEMRLRLDRVEARLNLREGA